MGARLSFEEEMGLLHEQFTNMLSLTENAIDKAIVALKTQDAALAQEIIDGDDEIDKAERKIEKSCLEIMVRQNPIASDLRRVTSIFKLITDLERIADHAEDISEILIRIKDQKYLKPLVDLPNMANKARAMVTKVIRSYLQRDVDMAYEVCAEDSAVDEMNHQITNDLIEMIKGNPASAEQAVALISITKYFERIADHATNIAEWVVYNETGKHKHIG
jgi:phosphate transport system protein